MLKLQKLLLNEIKLNEIANQSFNEFWLNILFKNYPTNIKIQFLNIIWLLKKYSE